MKRRFYFVLAAAAALSVGAATPVIDADTVSLQQDRATRCVTVGYQLANEPAVVTAVFFTNGVAIAGRFLTTLTGDVSTVVEPGSRQMRWMPSAESWGEFRATGLTVRVTAWATNSTPDYLVVHLYEPYEKRYYETEGSLPLGIESDAYRTEYLVMRRIHAANVTWMMGSPTWERSRTAAAETPHEVLLTNDYYMGVFEMTQGQYTAVTNMYPGYAFANCPLDLSDPSKACQAVSGVHYYDHLRPSYFNHSDDGFVEWPAGGHNVPPLSFLGLMRGKTGLDFDLPTEAEWEFACRAGSVTAFCNGNPPVDECDIVRDVAHDYWRGYRDGGNYGPHRVGTLKPNAWGLYDMHGNVCEWCLDRVDLTKTVAADSVIAPVGETSGSLAAIRGGHGIQSYSNLRSAARASGNRWLAGPDNMAGFRVVCRGGLE